ncbi:hypothetical protein VTJ83DRAFT_2791 [Remersonia thermophila]|uniref:Peptidase A1 domain-containing protein n=1 Tax=Remersonia thermophila TaxID=72144 RepID=A0ABR4DJY4_9PEZI
MAPSMRLSALATAACVLRAAAQHVLLPFSQHRDAQGIAARASLQATIGAPIYPYAINVSIGDPPQPLSLLISPSASHTWVPDANTAECSPEWYYKDYYEMDEDDLYDYYGPDFTFPQSECKWGSYNKSLSTTYLDPNRRYTSFSESYIDGFRIRGDNMTDRLTIGDIVIDDYPMGISSYSSYRYIGVLGLGHNMTDSYSSYSSGIYSNVMDRLLASGKIASKLYSMWLDDPTGASGSLLLGAVDRSRYTGDLVRLRGETSRYGLSISLSSVNGSSTSGDTMPAIRSNDFPVDVIFGPGEVLSFLPQSLVDPIAQVAGATYNKTMRFYTIPCDAGHGASFVFELGGAGGPKLAVEASDLVVPRGIADGIGWHTYLKGLDNVCLFGIQKHYSSSSSSSSSSYDDDDTNHYNLGSLVLRRTYLAFDLVNDDVAVAPVKFASGSDAPSPDIVAVKSYHDSIPASTPFCDSSSSYYYSCSTSSGGSGSRDNGSNSGNGSGSTPGNVDEYRNIAIGVGVSMGVLVLAGIVFAVVIFRRLRRGDGPGKEADEEASDRSSSSSGSDSATPAVPSTTPARGSAVPPPTNLPVIQEGSELAAAISVPAPAVLPARTPSPLAASERGSDSVSALSSDVPAPPAGASDQQPPSSPKGKGKEADRSAAGVSEPIQPPATGQDAHPPTEGKGKEVAS